jgi:alcohol dehydrogenase/propanol-preferring alcohol dehydrogenase
MCAGITTINSLRNSGSVEETRSQPSASLVWAYLAVQFVSKVGFHAIARGKDKEPLARQFSARHYIDSTAADPTAESYQLRGAKIIVATATSARAMAATSVDGRLVVLGASWLSP